MEQKIADLLVEKGWAKKYTEDNEVKYRITEEGLKILNILKDIS